MSKLSIQLTGFTIAPVNVKEMVKFYNNVFAAELIPFEAFGTTIYQGQLAGFDLTLCPNSILKIRAERNRQQLSLAVNDIAKVIKLALDNGGRQMQEVTDGPDGLACGITDPDGNSIEVTQPKA